jgi:hypothetical protein
MDLLEITASGSVLCDGGWGTELQKRGLLDGECPDRWNLVQPAGVVDVSDLAEASLSLRACRANGLPVLVSFAFESGKNKWAGARAIAGLCG